MKALRWTEEQLAAHQHKRLSTLEASAEAPEERSVFRSKLEARFADELEGFRRLGDIISWCHEPVRIRIGCGAYYKPDFMVVVPGGRVAFYEVKGHWREAARVRIKVAASLHPYWRFTAVQYQDGAWRYEEFRR